MLNQLKKLIKRPFIAFVDRICRREFDNQEFRRFNERPIEWSFLFRVISQIYPKRILDVGTGKTALPHLLSQNCGLLVTATDNVTDYWPDGMHNRHWLVLDDDITQTKLTGPFDLVTCISALEHMRESDKAVANMFKLLEPGGHLVITCPYTENSYVENVYDLPNSSYGKGNPYITQSYCRKNLDRWLQENNATIVDQEFWRFWEGDHWTVGKQIIPPVKASADESHQHSCVLLRKN